MIQKIYRHLKSRFPKKGDVYWNTVKCCYLLVTGVEANMVHCRTSVVTRSDAFDVFVGLNCDITNHDQYHVIEVEGEMIRIGFRYKMDLFRFEPSLVTNSMAFMVFSRDCQYITKISDKEMKNFENRMVKAYS